VVETGRLRREPQALEGFLRTLIEEVAVCARYDLPLSVLALRTGSPLSEGEARNALDALRTADLACRPDPHELLVGLPNTTAENARIVEERLRSIVPEAASGVASCREGDTSETLVGRARADRDHR